MNLLRWLATKGRRPFVYPPDPCAINEGGTYDGMTLLELSDPDWPRARPYQEDGHLADDAYHKEHDA